MQIEQKKNRLRSEKVHSPFWEKKNNKKSIVINRKVDTGWQRKHTYTSRRTGKCFRAGHRDIAEQSI